MSQKNNTFHFVIHDANGQLQKIKVLQNSNNNKIIGPIKIKQSPIKIIKVTPHKTIQGPPENRQNQSEQVSFDSKCVQLSSENKEVNTVKVLQCTPDIKIEIEEEEEHPENRYQEVTELQELKFSQTNPDIVPLPVRSVTLSSNTEGSPEMSQATRRRRNSDNDAPTEYTTKRRRHADKVGKGLRHFSMKVCEKVRNKGFTSYNEVADELVLEFSNGMHGSGDTHYDQKNIRRRVYDALNVLMAMNIISKDKKEIRWLGLPTNSLQECNTLERDKQLKMEQIQKKTQQLQELILQHISFKSLIERNKEAESKGVKPSPSSAIHLPFIVVNTSEKALIDCSISNDKTEYMFNFNKRFQIHDDIDILKRMGLLFGLDKGECSEQEIEKAKSMVPKSLESYVEQMGRGETTKLASIIKEEDLEEFNEDTLSNQGDAEPDDDVDGDDDGNEYSDDSSDVDV